MLTALASLNISNSHQTDSHQDSPSNLKHKAAIIIQKYVRRWLVMQSHLSSDIALDYRTLCSKLINGDRQGMLRAPAGRTLVFLHERGIVLKNTGPGRAIARFGYMQKIRSILRQQKSSHLVVPKANKWGDILVEERLPIHPDNYHNMGTYAFSPELFNDAVGELTRLFSEVYLDDLISNHSLHPLGKIPGVNNSVRYDNLPLYIVEKKGKKEGKIGLIDLERIQDSQSSKWLAILARIFPYHLDIIQQQASELKMEFDASQLNDQAACGRKYLQVGFIDHFNWLKNKSITATSPLSFSVSEERREFLIIKVRDELLKINQGEDHFLKGIVCKGISLKDFMKQNPLITAMNFAKRILPEMIDDIRIHLKSSQMIFLQSWGFTSMEEVTPYLFVSLRSPLIMPTEFYLTISRIIGWRPSFNINGSDLSDYQNKKRPIAIHIFNTVMEELVRGGELFSFEPAPLSHRDGVCWIRY